MTLALYTRVDAGQTWNGNWRENGKNELRGRKRIRKIVYSLINGGAVDMAGFKEPDDFWLIFLLKIRNFCALCVQALRVSFVKKHTIWLMKLYYWILVLFYFNCKDCNAHYLLMLFYSSISRFSDFTNYVNILIDKYHVESIEPSMISIYFQKKKPS